MSEDDIEDLVASIGRTFKSDVKRLEARITIAEAKARSLEARIEYLEAALELARGTARSRQFIDELQFSNRMVPPEEVVSLHSTSTGADGTVSQLFDLRDGRTGCRTLFNGETDAPILRAD